MHGKKVSVIVPVYRTLEWLARCVQSITGQTYKNLEIILVDDGSPDDCPALCDDWAQRDDRIRVLHKENGGLVSAWMAGVSMSTGDYLCFVDSDDWIDACMVEKCWIFRPTVEKRSSAAIMYRRKETAASKFIRRWSRAFIRGAACRIGFTENFWGRKNVRLRCLAA